MKRTVLEDEDPELLEHIRRLGLATPGEYRAWCTANGFSRKLKKPWKARCREFGCAQKAVADLRLRITRRERRSPVEVVRAICRDELAEHEISQPHFRRLWAALQPDRSNSHEGRLDTTVLERLVVHAANVRARFFQSGRVIAALGDAPGNSWLEALALVAANWAAWLRPLEDWKPRSHSARRQFASLLRHLFARFDDVPAFFDSVWFAGHSREAARRREWYRHVGRGENIRHCPLPIPFTKRMAHHFMHAPADLTVDQALRWGQVLGLGGDERLARALFPTRLARGFDHEEFWITVIRWFIEHPMLDRAHVGPIVDYLHEQRFVPEVVHVAPGQRVNGPPAQPNLTMKDRSPSALLARVHDWHRKLGRSEVRQLVEWSPCGIPPFEFLEGSEKNRTLRCWTIRELTSNKALFVEGREMKHCVGSYSATCARGESSIWAMEVETYEGQAKLLTVEVRPGARLVCQARGKMNRLPTEKERAVLHRWAAFARLRVADYV